MTTETITWYSVAERLPDDEQTVLIALEGDSEPVWLGFHTWDAWYLVSGARSGRVTHWADMPGGPKACSA